MYIQIIQFLPLQNFLELVRYSCRLRDLAALFDGTLHQRPGMVSCIRLFVPSSQSCVSDPLTDHAAGSRCWIVLTSRAVVVLFASVVPTSQSQHFLHGLLHAFRTQILL